MASSLKVGSAWKQITGLSTKVGGNWKTVSAAYTKVGGVWKQWYAPVVIDDFNRSTSGNLGTTTSGASWSNLRQSWYANGSKAQCDLAANTYALATVGFGNTKFLASAGVTNGTGLAFWIQDADNWYAAYAFQTTTSSSYLCAYESCAPCTSSTTTYTPTYSGGCVCDSGDTGGGVETAATSTTYKCATGVCDGGCTGYLVRATSGVCASGETGPTFYSVPACGLSTPPQGQGWCYKVNANTDSTFCNGSSSTASGPCCCGATTVGTTETATAGTAGTCKSCSHTTVSCAACPVYCPTTVNAWALRLIKMTAGVIALAATDVTLTGTPAAIKVSTESGNIEVQAFSDAAMTTQMGSTLSHTPTSTGPGQYIGLIKAPSDSQGSTVDNLLITL